tara:strand:+ start:3154 stop:3978 length:825 start_codon:yes stop_codon:yes gene_type:complete
MSENVETNVGTEENNAAAPPAIKEAPKNASEAREAKISELVAAMKASQEMQDNENLNSEDNHKVDYQQMVEGLSEDGQKFIGNLRRSYTKKTQELAEQRREIEQQRAQIEAQQKAMMQSDFSKQVQEAASGEDVKIDVFDEKSVEKRIEQEVARRLNEMMKPMREEHTLQQRRLALQSFKSEHPDLEDYKHDIAAELKANDHMNLEQAYWMVKGRKLADTKAKQDQELKTYRDAARQAGLKIGGLNRGSKAGVPPNVKRQGAWAIYEYLHNNKK